MIRRAYRAVRSLLITLLVVGVLAYALGLFRAPELPEQAPDFTLPTLSGNLVTLSDLRGHTVVLNFWATWCGPCRFEIPAFARFSRDHPKVVVLGVVAREERETIEASVEELEIPYPVLLGDARTFQSYGIDTFPTTVVVGPDGAVRTAHAGIMLDPQLRWAAWSWED
jgi:thiol-disulfide isomerase/thioredoxin